MTTKPIDQMTTQEIADALNAPPSPSAITQMAAQYVAMKKARYVLPDGEIMEPKDYTDALDVLNKTLKKYVEDMGPMYVEGVGTLKIQERSLAWNWDCKSMAENNMATFARLLEMGAVTLDSKVADALEKAGQVTGFRGYGHRGGTTALIVER